MPAEAREDILARIAGALNDRAPEDPAAIRAEWEALPREYTRTGRLSLEERLDLLESRLRDYDAEVTRVAEHEVADVIAAVLATRGKPMIVPEGFAASWTPAGALMTVDDGLSSRELDQFAGVVTSATAAVAETGSLVLQDAPGQGRRAATLLPDFHLCVVRAADVVENVPEVFARLSASATLPITVVSGPSATADIEMTRIKGVHGPRFLHVLIVTA